MPVTPKGNKGLISSVDVTLFESDRGCGVCNRYILIFQQERTWSLDLGLSQVEAENAGFGQEDPDI